MRKVLILALLCLTQFAYSQKPPAKFGDVSKEEVEMTTYEADTSAAAVKLLDYAESNFNYNTNTGFILMFDRLIRIKILKKDGYEWGDFGIPIYNEGGNSEKVSTIKGITYNLENGKVVESKLKKEGIFDEKLSDNWDIKKITMPDVKVGSVIEISYTVSSEFFTNLNDWEFQTTIPVVWSEYRLQIPEYYNYDKYMQGYTGLTVRDEIVKPTTISYTEKERASNKNVVKTSYTAQSINLMENHYRYVAENVPAFKPEPFITTSADYISKINFELAYIKYPNSPIRPILGTWDDINKTFWEDTEFGGQIKGNNFLKNIVEEVTAGLTTPAQKVGAIYYYVKQNVAWDGTYRRYIATPLRKVLDEKKGSSAEINFLLASMLEKLGFEVSPVLVSTRNHGFVRQNIPISSQFNTVICLVKIDENSILLDASSRYLPAGELPENCLNGSGFVVGKDRYSWVKLESTQKSRVLVSTELEIAEDELLRGKVSFDRTGYYAQRNRSRYFVDGEEKYLKDLTEDNEWEVSSSQFTDAKETTLPFKEEYAVEIKDKISSAGNIFYVDPFVADKLEENIFKLESREYPVDFGSPFERVYMAKITVPEGYAVEEMPESKIFMLPENGARYIYSISQLGNVINITSSLSINKSIFTQVEYPNLREFYNQVVAKQAEMVVIKKN